MPIMMSLSIAKSVGAGGANDKADVTAVQRQLNGHMNPPRVPLAVDGKIGKKTIGTIKDFQRAVLGFKRPDGRVDVMGKSHRALNDPMSEGKWAGMSMAPEDYVPSAPSVPGGPEPDPEIAIPPIPQGRLTASEMTVLEKLYEHVASKHQLKPAKDVLDDFVINELQVLKALLAVQGLTQYAVEFLEGIAIMRRHGFTAKEIVLIFKNTAAARHTGKGIDDLVGYFRVMTKNPRLASTLRGLGRAALAAAVLIAAIEAVNHFRKGDIGPGMAEAYGALMSVLIPWAGAMNALQGLVYAYYPNVKSPHVDAGFKLLIAMDPIGAGKTAVDTAWTLQKAMIVAVFEGKYPMHEIEALAARMRNSPMKIFTDLGEDIGDALGGPTLLPLIDALGL